MRGEYLPCQAGDDVGSLCGIKMPFIMWTKIKIPDALKKNTYKSFTKSSRALNLTFQHTILYDEKIKSSKIF